ncbi:hypothetical protein [Roseomonas sp. CECT 9278]|uniref:hypothetical protein n=1 Tax=Roseomonas sp. CECT 9278 TaxID=2845823 RepID=UPI001E492914|nr:hypothetical protein [Roseomonas sp. CECT 9278]CAH0208770.1 hypothetical protein ROS9278_02115 [Roseomonas sp. CECT 9278]
MLLVVGCALPPNTALRDWSRAASVAVDRPALLAPPDRRDGLAAQQAALAIYLYALGVLAQDEQPLTFDAAAFAALPPRAAVADPAAGRAVHEIGVILAAARAANLAPGARANSAAPAPLVEDNRLRQVIRTADAPVQALVGALAAGLDAGGDADRGTYARLLAAIGEDHAMLRANATHIRAREVARGIMAAQDRMARLARRLPPDPMVAARVQPAGLVAAVVQP